MHRTNRTHDPRARTPRRGPAATAVLPAVLGGALLGACGGGGGGAAALVPPNLTGTTLAVTTAEPMAGHELDLVVGLASNRELRDVALAFYAVFEEDLQSRPDDPRQHRIDEQVLALVPAGASTHTAELLVPADLEPRGAWVIVARVDPLNAIAESNEDDNLAGTAGAPVVITIDDVHRDTPDLVLERVALDTDVIVLEQNLNLGTVRAIPDAPNHHIGATAHVRTSGARQLARVEMTVQLEIPGTGWQALQVWDPARRGYGTNWFVPELHPDKPNEVHLDVLIPEALRARLVADIRRTNQNLYDLRFTVNAGGSIQEWENGAQRWRDRPDNQLVVRAALVVPADPPALGLAWAEDFAKSWQNETFGIGVDFHAGSSLDARGLTGRYLHPVLERARSAAAAPVREGGELDAAVPVRLFGQDFALVAAELYAQDAPHDTRLSRFHLGVSVLGQVVYGKDVVDPSYEYTDTPFQAVKSVEHRALVFAGPVPIELKAGVMGELGFDLTFRMDTASAALEGKPYFAITGYASAGVNLVAASVAVRGDLELLRDELTASLRGTLAVTGAGRYLEGQLLLDATNVLTGPNGRIFLEATYPGVKLCKVLGVPVPCGVTTHRKEKTLAKFETFTKTDVLFRKPSTVFRYDLQN